MEIIRPIKDSDFQAFASLAEQRGKGMTGLPRDPKFLRKIIQQSRQAFSKTCTAPSFLHYQFVLEDLDTSELLGACGIKGKTGGDRPICMYSIEEEQQRYTPPTNTSTLCPVVYKEGPSEIYGLFLKKQARNKELGRLLSLSRFLFIKDHSERFTDQIIAEIRGTITKQGKYPFWEMFGRLFCDLSGDEAHQIRIYHPKKVPEMLPRHPVYICLLPKKVQTLLQETHTNTKAALSMLLEEGFYCSNEIDIIDAGPVVAADKEKIRVSRKSRTKIIQKVVPKPFSKKTILVSNCLLDFRCCLSCVQENDKGVILDQQTADALKVSIGDRIRFVEAKARGRRSHET